MVVAATDQQFVDLNVGWYAWVVFGAVVAALLVLDLLVLHRDSAVPGFRRAIVESLGWLTVGVAAGLVMLLAYGGSAAAEYYTGYLIELSLSVDNVFVWALILGYFAVPREYQHRVLFWGIFGAIALRAVFIFGGIALVERFEWTLALFGVFLLYSAFQVLRHDEDQEVDYETNRLLRLVRRVVPSSDQLDGHKLFTRVGGRRLATPLFAVLVLVEFTDVLFAVDSVPAVLGVAREQFIVLTSNAFAILGLRAMYFLFAELKDRFSFLQHGLAIILAFVGVKLILEATTDIHFPSALSLIVIAVVLGVSVAASLARPTNEPVR